MYPKYASDDALQNKNLKKYEKHDNTNVYILYITQRMHSLGC